MCYIRNFHLGQPISVVCLKQLAVYCEKTLRVITKSFKAGDTLVKATLLSAELKIYTLTQNLDCTLASIMSFPVISHCVRSVIRIVSACCYPCFFKNPVSQCQCRTQLLTQCSRTGTEILVEIDLRLERVLLGKQTKQTKRTKHRSARGQGLERRATTKRRATTSCARTSRRSWRCLAGPIIAPQDLFSVSVIPGSLLPELQNSNSTLALPSLICLICAKHCKIQIQCNTFTIFQYLPYLPWCLATFCVSLLRIRQNLSWSTRFNEHPEMTSEIKEPNCGQLRFEGRKLVSEWLTE